MNNACHVFIQCCIFLDDPQTVSEILKKLSKGELVGLANGLTVDKFITDSIVYVEVVYT